jgi:hypothetical protein
MARARNAIRAGRRAGVAEKEIKLTPDWRRQLKGAFAFDSAPFAIHPNDERRAIVAVSNAIRSGATKADIEQEIGDHFRSRNAREEFISYQLKLFRSHFSRQYSMVRNCWVLSKPLPQKPEFVAIFSGRTGIDSILSFCAHIYESREYNNATQFMRAKKKVWPIFRIQFHAFPSGALWEGKAIIGNAPEYLLEKADATLSKGLDPSSTVVWKPKPVPDDPGETWHGIRYRS